MTVREIARLAGVSVATVSRVSNGTGQVSPQMRRRVLDAIEAHGYRPHHLGQALAAGKHGAVGLVFPGLAGPYFGGLIQGFESEVVESRSAVHILCTHMRKDSDVQILEMARRVDGIALLGGIIPDDAIERLATRVPVVILAGKGPGDIPSVRVENTDAMARLTRHLLVDHGLRELQFVGTPEHSPDVGERWIGFEQAHRDLGLSPAPALKVAMAQQDGVMAAERLLQRRPPQAVVCSNDELALGVLVGALGRGLRVPQDVVITGFDDAPMSELVSPPLTTVRQPVRELAAQTARLLLSAHKEPIKSAVLPTELVIRASCGCPSAER
jgi:LacI family transcriptional regulator